MLIKLEKFEGPLSLLLKMIEGEELDITTISLAKIADEYVSYIKANSDIDPEEIADFLVVAAKLLLIKSRALLPYLYPEVDEEIDDLTSQIKMYKEYLQATKLVAGLAALGQRAYAKEFSRQTFGELTPRFTPPPQLTAERLRMTADDLLARWRPAESLENSTINQVISIEEKIDHIRQLLHKQKQFNFSRLMRAATSKTEVIVGFLAILELMKQRDVLIEQTALFGEIEVKLKL